MIDPDVLPTYGGSEVTYSEFAAVGIAVGVFIQFGLNRVSAAMRGEQLMGTLESVLVTPTAPATIQLGLRRMGPRLHPAPNRDLSRLRSRSRSG